MPHAKCDSVYAVAIIYCSTITVRIKIFLTLSYLSKGMNQFNKQSHNAIHSFALTSICVQLNQLNLSVLKFT